MKIAFTSCMDPLDADTQPVWNAIAAESPEHLVLLGDQIYMDYGFEMGGPDKKHFLTQQQISHNPRLLVPSTYAPAKFATEMYDRYQKQWGIMRATNLFNDLYTPPLHIHGIWDDHDFGWNNSFGSGDQEPGSATDVAKMPPAHQKISRALFQLFFEALQSGNFREMPTVPTMTATGVDLTIPNFFSSLASAANDQRCGCVELREHEVYLHLLDCRTFRDNFNRRSMVGDLQLNALANNLRPNAINLVASSTTLRGSRESWEHYAGGNELQRLTGMSTPAEVRMLVLSGDIHKVHYCFSAKPYEVTASGAARPLANVLPHLVLQALSSWLRPGVGNFGIVDFGEIPDRLGIQLHTENGLQYEGIIKAGDW